jgi:sugar phosphate isomerase/epimerase
MTDFSRKKFLQLGLATTAALISQNSFANSLFSTAEESKKLKSFGIQLWSVRDDMYKNAKETLKTLASYGYKEIESFDGTNGMWWGMNHLDFKKYLTDNGLTIHSSHCNTKENFEKKAAEAAAIGVKYLIYPWEGAIKTIDEYKKLADEFNQKGDICKKNGIRFAFHNHDYSFKNIDNQYGQDVLMKNTDAASVDYQMDIYWVVTSGHDPVAWIKKYPNRFTLSHIKDRTLNATDTNASCILGTGQIDFKRILKTARKNGMRYFNVEQEKWDNSTPLLSAEANAKYIRKLKF